ncbi:hypothetical protein Nmn1133_02205 [Halosegnis longus]|uniref:Uncharacterized protein n=1 Tax=Halosegnis longus TaxID=2216012 RepID=A0AAJ4UV44_9EURY|nr:hypothetical protein Nmn1133_02205 [Salella cibi]
MDEVPPEIVANLLERRFGHVQSGEFVDDAAGLSFEHRLAFVVVFAGGDAVDEMLPEFAFEFAVDVVFVLVEVRLDDVVAVLVGARIAKDDREGKGTDEPVALGDFDGAVGLRPEFRAHRHEEIPGPFVGYRLATAVAVGGIERQVGPAGGCRPARFARFAHDDSRFHPTH